VDRTFVVVLRATSSARFLEDERLHLRQITESTGTIDVVFRTRYADEGLESPLPRELWIDVRGKGSSLNESVNVFARMAAGLLPVLALVSNAAIHDPVVHLAYEDTTGVNQREFFQAFVPDEKGSPLAGRRVELSAVFALLHAIDKHAGRERIERAMTQYRLALLHWTHGEETLAIAHLFMGMEALTKVFLRRECEKRELTEEKLAALFNIEKKHLDPYIRRTFLFKENGACYNRAKEASDGFEHGFLNFNRIHTLAMDVRDQTATYLRNAIFEISGCDPATLAGITKGRYLTPLGAWSFAKYLRGILKCDGPSLALEGQEYPIMEWRSSIRVFRKLENGKYEFAPDETMTAKIGEGIQFAPGSIEVWGPNDGTGSDGNYQSASVQVWPKARNRGRQITEEGIAVAAYYLWKNGGEQHGHDIEHWFAAKYQLQKEID
jgi:Protein of unknown function (DUF2934)